MNMSVYNSLSTQKELEKLLEIRGHNLANAGTDGFLSRDSHISGNGKDKFGTGVTYAQNSGFFTNMHQGPVRHTGDAFDIALKGENFLVVGTADGEALTKSGHLNIRNDGMLVTANNYPLLDVGGGQISIPANVRTISISRDGLITADNEVVGQLRVVKVNDARTNLSHANGNLFTAPQDAIVEDNKSMSIQQYFITGSNVEPITELVAIMKIQQQYQKTMGVVGETAKNGQESTENLLTSPQNT